MMRLFVVELSVADDAPAGDAAADQLLDSLAALDDGDLPAWALSVDGVDAWSRS